MRVALCVLCLAAATTAFTWERQAPIASVDDEERLIRELIEELEAPEMTTEPTTETESEPTQKCGADMFFCESGVRQHKKRNLTVGDCIPNSYKCDGNFIDCNLNEDELNCEGKGWYKKEGKKYRECTDKEFKCPSGQTLPDSDNSHCIGDSSLCDGFPDCLGGEDEAETKEAGCKHEKRDCKKSEFYCPEKSLDPQEKNGYCIKSKYVCDDDFDCHMGYDEMNCPDKATRTTTKLPDSADQTLAPIASVHLAGLVKAPIASVDDEERLIRELIEELEAPEMTTEPTTETESAEKVAMMARNINADLMGDVNALATSYFECYNVALAYKSYFEASSVYLPCFDGLMHHYEKTCYEMASKLNSYLVHRGGKAMFPTVELSQACKNIIKDPEAKLGRTSDTTARMCICEFMDDQTANFNIERTQACPDRSLWKNGLFAAEDLTQMLKHVNGKLMNLEKAAKTEDDADLSGWLDQPLHAMVSAIKATYDMVTLLDKTVAEKNYRMMEKKFNTGHCLKKEEKANHLQSNRHGQYSPHYPAHHQANLGYGHHNHQGTRMARKLPGSDDHAKAHIYLTELVKAPVANDDEEGRLVRELIEQLEARN